MNRPRPALLSTVLAALVSGALLAPLTTISATAAPAGPGQPAARMAPTAEPKRIQDQWIVRFDSDATGKQFRNTRDGSKKRGARIHYQYSRVFQGFAATMSGDEVTKLRKKSFVLAVEPDYEVHASATQSPAPSWGLDRIDQRGLPLSGGYTYSAAGAGVTAYVIDSGIRSAHVEFGGRVATGFSAISDGRGTQDCNGHGTHVAGSLGGASYGVAKQVTLIPVRVLNCTGSGSTSGVIAGVDWVTNRVRSVGGPSVANLSLGGGASSALDSAVNNSINSGVSYAVAAGNAGGNACATSPARVPAAVTVGASTRTDVRASFSNYGSCLDLFAPGEGIVSSYASSDTAAASMNGTSMASPHVAGVIATYLQSNPGATPAAVRTALVDTAGDALSSLGTGSPDKLLFSVLGGGSTPTPTPAPTPTPMPTPTPAPTPGPANAAPVATPPAAVLAGTGNRIGTSSVPMTVSWAATDADGDVITGYTLQYSSNGGSSWTTVALSSPAATSATLNLASTTNLFRVRATDDRGAVGGYANGPQFTLTLSQQGAAALSPSTNWSTVNHSDASGGSLKQAKAAGSTATFSFTGTQIAWIATWSPNRGRAEIFLDGVSQGTVNLYSAAVSTRRILFSKKIAAGSHTLVIKVLGTKDSRSASSYIDVDAFVTVR